MDKTVLLQKTIRDNNEDLQNFMRDLKFWESDMKRKDSELSSKDVSNEFLPPVRSKPRKEKKPSLKKVVKKEHAEVKKISSTDYSSWEKFDVEKACNEVDETEKSKEYETDSSDGENDKEKEMSRLRQQALYEKDLGNTCVKKEKWKEAIDHYTKAIKCYDKDAIFYANRALCYLKTNQFKIAEEDCTKSLNFDSQYVKAYQRRAAARIALKKIKEAQSDLSTILKLEPSNTQAKKDLDKLKADSKSSNVKLPEKIPSNKADISKPSLSSPVVEKSVNKQEYPWDPVDPARIVKPVYKPPHLRSKKLLKRIEIIDVDDSSINNIPFKKNKNLVTVASNKIEIPSNENVQSSSSKIFKEKSHCIDVVKENIPEKATKSKENDILSEKSVDTSVVPEPDTTIEVPPPARTSVQFYTALKKLKGCPDLLYQYLQKIDAKNFPSIFQDSLESDAFSIILQILAGEFIKHGDTVSNYLWGLCNIRRFEMLVLFMSKQDKEGVKKLLEYCSERKEIGDEQLSVFQKKFQLSY